MRDSGARLRAPLSPDSLGTKFPLSPCAGLKRSRKFLMPKDAVCLRDRLAFGCLAAVQNSAMKPYSVCLLERFRSGEAVSELSAREGIPVDRIRIRLDAAVRLEWIRATAINADPETRAA